MCGIAGYLGPGPSDATALHAAMRAAIRYRGRDGEAAWGEPGGTRLFHARLSIIDLVAGDQPMTDISDRFTIVFNGEIYNYRELAVEYASAGARFRTHSDTEVILEGYKLKGERVCADLNGMFAFAIWDNQERTMFLARDRLGKKPLYWTEISRTFYFASTIDAFTAIPGWTGEFSLSSLDVYGAVGAVPIGRTAFRQAFQLPPGSHAIVTERRLCPQPTIYWRMDFSRKRSIGIGAALEELEPLLTNAIDIRLRADVPVCLTFSGGVDSGLIAALATRRLNRQLTCWTIDYHTADDPSEETVIAEQVASLLGLDWRFKNFDYHNELFPILRMALREVDSPCSNMALSYSRSLYEAIRPEAKVVLSGNGSDELFLGYNGNEELLARDQLRQRPALAAWLDRVLPKGIARRLGGPPLADLAEYQIAYVRAYTGCYPGEPDPEVLMEELRFEIKASQVASYADLYTWMSLRYYTTDTNFRLPDIAGLAAQVEVRSPLLDYRIVDFAARLPTELKIGKPDGSDNKSLLKELYARYVPNEIARASKKGMAMNLRYDRTLASDPDLLQLYERLLERIKAAGIEPERYRTAWRAYVNDRAKGVEFPATAGIMVAGLMLGLWLDRRLAG